jgi:endonuclease III
MPFSSRESCLPRRRHENYAGMTMDKKMLVGVIIKRLKKEFPVLKCGLDFNNPFELLVSTILSAQSTDVHVNKVAKTLFMKYRTVKDFAAADRAVLEKDVSSVNFYRNKAQNIQNAAKIIVERFGGAVPQTMEELVTLPGVARKTANIVLYNAFGITEGIAVDTHVIRLAGRLGLTENTDPVKIEQDLMEITPKKEWGNLTHLLIYHGRKTCQARKMMHSECVLRDICPSKNL